jgi:hypothetical protein
VPETSAYVSRSILEYDRQNVPVLGCISENEVERATVKTRVFMPNKHIGKEIG